MNHLDQEFVIFEDDTLEIELPLEVIEFNNTYNIGSYDNVWFGIATAPGNSYILQKANYNWDQGLLTGGYYGFITNLAAFEAALPVPDIYTDLIPTTNGNGSGAEFTIQINSLNQINPAICQVTFGGLGYEPDDNLIFAASDFGISSPDLLMTLTPYSAPLVPAGTGDIEIDAPEGPSGPATIIVNFNQSDFAASGGPLVTGTKYYWEVVVGEIKNYSIANYDVPTQVVATGYMHVSESMFSIAGYRP